MNLDDKGLATRRAVPRRAVLGDTDTYVDNALAKASCNLTARMPRSAAATLPRWFIETALWQSFFNS